MKALPLVALSYFALSLPAAAHAGHAPEAASLAGLFHLFAEHSSPLATLALGLVLGAGAAAAARGLRRRLRYRTSRTEVRALRTTS